MCESLIQGTKANYIVAQATFREGADEQEEEEEAQEDEEENVEGEGEGEDEEEKLPESKWQPPMKIPSEPKGSGTNKFTFFVCNKVGKDVYEFRLKLSRKKQYVKTYETNCLFD